MRGDTERDPQKAPCSDHIQQFYERPERNGDEEPDEMTAILGPETADEKMEVTDFGERIAKRAGICLWSMMKPTTRMTKKASGTTLFARCTRKLH